LREFHIITKAAALRDARLAWQSAHYHKFAVHAPNDMPDEPSGRSARSLDPKVAEEIKRIQLEVAADKAKRKQHGR